MRGLLIAGAIGVAAAYFMDPDHGADRRSRLQGQALGLALELRERVRSAITGPDVSPAVRPDDDLGLLTRVERALLGVPDVRKGAVETEVVDGQVVLRGAVLSAAQERALVETAGRVPGVAGVESRLHVAG